MTASPTDNSRRERKRRLPRIVWILSACMFGFGAFVLVPVGPWANIYCPVSANAVSWTDVPFDQCQRTRSWFGADDYLVHEGQLFLRVQSTRPTLVLTWLDAPRWDVSTLSELVAAHGELRARLPRPGAADGGVSWLRR